MKEFLHKIQNNSFLKAFFYFYKNSEINMTSIAVAYYFLISVFPLLLVVVNILPYFQIDSADFLHVLNDFLPKSLYDIVAKIIQDILTQPSTGLLSFSIVSALWIFSQSIAFLQKAFNKAYGVGDGRSMIWSRIFGFLISLGMQLLLAVSLLLIVFGRMIVQFFYNLWKFDSSLYKQLLTMTEPVVYLVLFLSLLTLYFVLPNVKISKIRYVLPGSILVVLVLYSLMNLLGVYMDAYTSRFLDVRFFGSVVMIVIMVWFIIITKVLIIGAVLNASLQSLFVQQFEMKNGKLVSFLKREEKKKLQKERKTRSNGVENP